MFGSQRSWRYLCIIYDTLGIKCSQARVNNSRIKSLLGFTVFVPSIFAFFKKILLENTYCFSLKMWLAGQFSFWAKILPSVSYMIHPTFFTLMVEKTYFKLNHRLINCIFLWPHILTYFIALNINNILKYPGHGTKYMSCIIYDTRGTRELINVLLQRWNPSYFTGRLNNDEISFIN